MKHTTIDSIEAEFIPPDITTDMYGDPDFEDEDPEWKDFLSNLFKNGTEMFFVVNGVSVARRDSECAKVCNLIPIQTSVKKISLNNYYGTY